MKKSILLLLLLLLLLIVLLIKINKNPCDKSYVSFTFDDANKDVYLNAFPIFKDNDIEATVYVITGEIAGSFEEYGLMSLDQLRELESDGWEIGSHTINHKDLTKLDDVEINKELVDSKQYLLDNGFDVKTLAIPYGKYNGDIKEISKKYYESTRPSIWGSNSFKDLDRYNLRSYWVLNTTTNEQMKSWIGEDSWTIFMIHHVSLNNSIEYSINPKELKDIIKFIKDKKIEIKIVSEVLEMGCDDG